MSERTNFLMTCILSKLGVSLSDVGDHTKRFSEDQLEDGYGDLMRLCENRAESRGMSYVHGNPGNYLWQTAYEAVATELGVEGIAIRAHDTGSGHEEFWLDEAAQYRYK
jgi:hypothetical protein